MVQLNVAMIHMIASNTLVAAARGQIVLQERTLLQQAVTGKIENVLRAVLENFPLKVMLHLVQIVQVESFRILLDRRHVIVALSAFQAKGSYLAITAV